MQPGDRYAVYGDAGIADCRAAALVSTPAPGCRSSTDLVRHPALRALALLARAPLLLWASEYGVGAAAVALGTLARDAPSDSVWLSWDRPGAHKRPPRNYVPVCRGSDRRPSAWAQSPVAANSIRRAQGPAATGLGPGPGLELAGRWPLTIYLVHKQILMRPAMAVWRQGVLTRHLAASVMVASGVRAATIRWQRT